MDKPQRCGQTAFGFSVDKVWTSGFAVLRIASRLDHTLDAPSCPQPLTRLTHNNLFTTSFFYLKGKELLGDDPSDEVALLLLTAYRYLQ
jgi:hypothetical protein